MEQFLNACWPRNFESSARFFARDRAQDEARFLSCRTFLDTSPAADAFSCLSKEGTFTKMPLSSHLSCIGWFLCTKLQRIRRFREVASVLLSWYLKFSGQGIWTWLNKQCLVWQVLSMCRVHNLSPLLFNRQCCGHVVSVPQALLDFFFFFFASAVKGVVCNKWVFFLYCLPQVWIALYSPSDEASNSADPKPSYVDMF